MHIKEKVNLRQIGDMTIPQVLPILRTNHDSKETIGATGTTGVREARSQIYASQLTLMDKQEKKHIVDGIPSIDDDHVDASCIP